MLVHDLSCDTHLWSSFLPARVWVFRAIHLLTFLDLGFLVVLLGKGEVFQVGLVGVPHAPAVELVGDPTAVLRHLRGLEMSAFVFLYLDRGKTVHVYVICLDFVVTKNRLRGRRVVLCHVTLREQKFD